MNETFSLKRFSLLFRKQFAEHHRLYLISGVLVAGVLLLWLGFMTFTKRDGLHEGGSDQVVVFVVTLLVSGLVFTSTVFHDLIKQEHGSFTLTLPASHIEKFLNAWLHVVVLFLVFYLGVFLLIDQLMVQLNNRLYDAGVKPVSFRDEGMQIGLAVFVALQSLVMLGAISFKSRPLVKTLFCVLIAFVLLAGIDRLLGTLLLPVPLSGSGLIFGSYTLETTDPVIPVGNNLYMNVLSIKAEIPHAGFICLLLLLSWTAAFFKLKEAQM